MSLEGVDADREFFVSLDANSSTSAPIPVTPLGSTVVVNVTYPTIAPTDAGLSYTYICQDGSAEAQACPVNCTGLEACMDCECEILYLEDTGGPWGEVMDVIFCLLPIIYLIYATIKPNPTPTTTSLPFSAVIMFLVRVMYLGSNPLLVSACVILGVHEAITPLTIMAGAITLFETMEATKCLPYMMREMKALTAGHPVAEVMLLFGFATLVEGASGFGTPVALGAPMLVSQGHPPLESVVILLLFNTFATVWGAVGTPLWFGFGELGLSEDDFLEISLRASIAMVFSAFILIPFILTILIPFRIVKRNILFLLLSIATVMGPVVGLASVTYEFPSLMGGLIGCGLTAVLIKFKVGLAEMVDEDLEALAEEAGENAEENADVPIMVDDLMEITDITRGYHKAISDLTEAVIPSKSLKASAAAAASTNSAPAANGDGGGDAIPEIQNSPTDMTAADDENGDDPKKSVGWAATIEVQEDAKSSDVKSSTVVFMTEQPSDKKDGGKEEEGAPMPEQTAEAVADKDWAGNGEAGDADDDKKVAAVEEPPLVEEEQRKSQQSGGERSQKPLTKSQILAQSATSKEDALLGPRKTFAEGYLFETLGRTFPIWGVVILLILTRVGSIGIKEYLTKQSPYWEVQFGTYGDFRLSVSIVFQLRHILTYPNLNWKYELLYVPFLIPFVLISLLTMGIYRKDLTCRPQDIAGTVVGRLSSPAVALMGALILVQLMIKIDQESPAYILGVVLSDWLKQGFVVISPILGALGSFFSGSTTVSNLTFGEIQQIAAEQIGTSVNTMLALQAVGASAGNGICLNNIIAALAVVGLNVSEGQILMRTAKYVFCSTTIATVVMLAFFFRFN